jgi:hypothetical protein
MKYYYLGHLLEKYYDDRQRGVLRNRWDDHLTLWALDMLEADYSSPALLEAAGGFNWEQTHNLFEAILAELHIADDPSVIDDDFIDSIFIEEYKYGAIESGCELLFHRGHLRKKIGFPYYVHLGKYYPYGDSGRFKLGWHVDEVPDLHTDKLEQFVTDFLQEAGITR